MTGRCIADRYVLERSLGRGAQGEVFCAWDKRLGERVAIKLMPLAPGAPLPAWREGALLRRLRLPHVVAALDEGRWLAHHYLVMALASGAPFPGEPAPDGAGWAWWRGRLSSALGALRRVHLFGVAHGDVKPHHVLIDAQGVCTLLDFGLAHRASGEPRRDGVGPLVWGTLAYAAPELLRGAQPSREADLYAFGVMCYEALLGRLPHPGDRFEEVARARLSGQLPALDAPHDLPDEAREAIALLLSLDPAQRVVGAQRLAVALDAAQQPVRLTPWLLDGCAAPWRDAARQRQSLDMITRDEASAALLLDALAQDHAARGGRCVLPQPAEGPFESLLLALPQARCDVSASLASLHERLHEVVEALGDDALCVIPRWEALDPWSQRWLSASPSSLPMLRALPEPASHARARALAPLSAAQLREVFTGYEPIWHACEDASLALYQRTAGAPARVVAELQRWVSAGLVDASTWPMRLTALARVELPALGRLWDSAEAQALPSSAPLREALASVHLCWPQASAARVSELLAWPLWRAQACLESLAQSGHARLMSDDCYEATSPASLDALLDPARADALHRRALASHPGAHPARAASLLAVLRSPRDLEAILDEAEALDQGGHSAQACALLHQAWREAPQRALGAHSVQALLLCWARIALWSESLPLIEDALFAAEAYPDVTIAPLVALLEAARLSCMGGGEEALRSLDALATMDDEALRWCHQMYRVRASWSCALPVARAVIDQLEARVARPEHASWRSLVLGWRAMLAYREGDFAGAASLHLSAASGKARVGAKLSSQLNAANALLDALEPERALSIAEHVLERAARLRLPVYEAHALLIARASRYRRGDALTPEPAWLDALASLGASEQEGLAAFYEAAIAWRRDALALTRDCATRARRSWERSHNVWGARLARALMIEAGDPAHPDEIASLLDTLARCAVPRVGLQLAALLAPLSHADAWRPHVTALRAAIDASAPRAARLELLSLDECDARLSLATLRRDPTG